MRKIMYRVSHEALRGLLGLPATATVVQVIQRLPGENPTDTFLVKVYGHGPEVAEGDCIPLGDLEPI